MRRRRFVAGTLYLVGALLALANSGCLAAAISGCAVGAGFAGNAFCKGKVGHLYAAELADSLNAVRAALADMGMPLEKEQVSGHGSRIVLRTRTGDGDRVHVYLYREPSRIPSDGPMTRICVRVATFGDHPLSERILYQIGAHLIPQPPTPPAVGPAPSAVPPLAPPRSGTAAGQIE